MRIGKLLCTLQVSYIPNLYRVADVAHQGSHIDANVAFLAIQSVDVDRKSV
jgi:hypothetical protein